MSSYKLTEQSRITKAILACGGIKLEHSYTRNGCNFYGNLAVVYLYEAMQDHPASGQFNRGMICDYLDVARIMMRAAYPDHEEILAIPDLVCRIR